nr:hypothetical protein [uncultured Mediterranean phage uvMED]
MNRQQRRAAKSKKKSRYTGMSKLSHTSTFGSRMSNGS